MIPKNNLKMRLCFIDKFNFVLKLNLNKLFLFQYKYVAINITWYKKDQVTKANVQSEIELLSSS